MAHAPRPGPHALRRRRQARRRTPAPLRSRQSPRSEKAERKARTKLTADGSPVHSFQTLLADLATLAKNRLQPKDGSAKPFEMITTPTPLQQRALDLLGVSPRL